jgi:hypothetical protein
MPGTYQQLMARAREAYQLASNGFHPDAAVRGIATALDEFDQPLAEIDAAIGAGGPRRGGTATRDGLRLLDAQVAVLQAAIDGAARADRRKVAGAALLDQARFAQAAKIAQAADSQLMDAVAKLVRTVHEDASGSQDGGTDDLKPVNVAELEESLRARATAQDQFASAELEDIGGQRIEESSGGLSPANVAALEESLHARASSEDAFAAEEIKQISGQLVQGSA